MNFKKFTDAVNSQFNSMSKDQLYFVAVEKDTLWDRYLQSFPEGTNPIFRERTEHDCSICRHFIKNIGRVVAISDTLELLTVWDVGVSLPYPYNIVAKSMSEFVKQHHIHNLFIVKEKKYGMESNLEDNDSGIIEWNHFWANIPNKFISRRVGSDLSIAIADFNVLKRSLDEITLESVDDVLTMIYDGNLYRGDQYKKQLETFRKHKFTYSKLSDDKKQLYCWKSSSQLKSFGRIRNTAIGTLLVDLSNGVDIERAVESYETIIAPSNYRRPKPLVTKVMVENAKKQLEQLGLIDSLPRRYATQQDINVNDIIYVDRPTTLNTNDIFDEIAKESTLNKNAPSGKNVSIEEFIRDVVPNAQSIELFFEPRLASNLVSLITNANDNAKSLFSWDNPFSWTYEGSLADSFIKEKVKRAGGDVEGVLRCSLHWYNTDDLDIHVIEPDGYHIFFDVKCNYCTTGKLDVDMNVSNFVRGAVENITWTNESKMMEGIYKVYINNYAKRESVDVGFEVEIEYSGKIRKFIYDKPIGSGENITVAEFYFKPHQGIIEWIYALDSEVTKVQKWNISSNEFHKVSIITLSPNCWSDRQVGQKHYFFFIEGCKNPDDARGFFNEYLRDNLRDHRKVFEILGDKMKAPYTDNQLSGFGFSSTIRNSVIFKVTKNGKPMMYNVMF